MEPIDDYPTISEWFTELDEPIITVRLVDKDSVPLSNPIWSFTPIHDGKSTLTIRISYDIATGRVLRAWQLTEEEE